MPFREKERGQTYGGIVSAEVPLSDPMRAAWEAYKLTDEFATTRAWCSHIYKDDHIDGSLWAAFVKGYQSRLAAPSAAPQGKPAAGEGRTPLAGRGSDGY